jgi:hypothetical protein
MQMTYDVALDRAMFNLAPPTEEQFSELAAELDDQERRVLLEHGTEAPFCGIFLEENREGVFTCRLCGLPLFIGGTKFESGTAELHLASRQGASQLRPRHQLRDESDRDRLRSLRRPSGSCLPRRAATDRRALLHQLGLAGVHAEG